MNSRQRDRLIEEHLSLVHHIAGRIGAHLPENVERDDLISAGIIGLIRAVDRYDPSRGAKLATYASSVIRGEIMEALRERDWAPRSVRRRGREIGQAASQLEHELGRPPSEEEVAERLNMTVEEYRDAVDESHAATILSLEDALSREDSRDEQVADDEPSDQFGDPADGYAKKVVRKVIADTVRNLGDREKKIIALYYQEDLTLKEIGEILGVTESRVCQIHTRVIDRLRRALSRKLPIALAQ